MRAKFDENKDIKDFRIACALVEKAEQEVDAKEHWQPRKCE